MNRIFGTLLVSFVLAGCGGDAGEPTAGEEIADDYNEALDKAAAVEKTLQDAKDELDAAIDDGGDSDED